MDSVALSEIENEADKMDVVTRQILAHGVSAYNTANYDAAIDYFSTVLEFAEQDWQTRWFLAMAHFKANKVHHARHLFTYIAEHAPDSRMRAEAMSRLKMLIEREAC